MELCSLSAYCELQYAVCLYIHLCLLPYIQTIIISSRSFVIFALNEYNKGKIKWHAHRISSPSTINSAKGGISHYRRSQGPFFPLFFHLSYLCFSPFSGWFLMKPQDAPTIDSLFFFSCNWIKWYVKESRIVVIPSTKPPSFPFFVSVTFSRPPLVPLHATLLPSPLISLNFIHDLSAKSLQMSQEQSWQLLNQANTFRSVSVNNIPNKWPELWQHSSSFFYFYSQHF